MTNSLLNFQNACVRETGIVLDSQKMATPVMKTKYRDHKIFSNDSFKKSLLDEFSTEISNFNHNSLTKFLQICSYNLGKFSSCKKKYFRINNMSFMNKDLDTAHIRQIWLRSLFLEKNTSISTILLTQNIRYSELLSILFGKNKKYHSYRNKKDVTDTHT